MGVAPATPMEETRRVLEQRKAAGLDGGMQFTYRNPARSTDPGRVLAGAAALVVGAWWYGGPGRRSAHPAGRPQGRVARYAWRDHYADLRAALGQLAGPAGSGRLAARVVADDNALVDRAAADQGGLGWYGKNSNVLLPGRGSWFVLGSVVTDAPCPPTRPWTMAAGRAGAASAPARRAPWWRLACWTPGGASPGCSRRPASSLSSTGPPSAVVSTAATTARRSARPTASLAARLSRPAEQDPTARGRSRPARNAGFDAAQRCSLATGAGTSPTRPSLPPAQRAHRPGQHGGRPVARRCRRPWALPDGPDDLLRAHAIWAVLRLGRSDLRCEGLVPASDPSRSSGRDARGAVASVPAVSQFGRRSDRHSDAAPASD